MGIVELIGGAALTVAAVAVQGVVAAVIATVVGAVVFGGAMYAFVYRPAMRLAVESPAPAPTDDRESGSVTARRILGITGIVLVVFVLIAVVTGAFNVVAGMAVGNGAVLWWTSRGLRRWEDQAGRRLLREPRWRGREQEDGAWGRGMFDPRDFYVVPRS